MGRQRTIMPTLSHWGQAIISTPGKYGVPLRGDINSMTTWGIHGIRVERYGKAWVHSFNGRKAAAARHRIQTPR